MFDRFIKEAARKEIELLRDGLLGEQSVARLAANTSGVNERYINRIGSGFNQHSDLVLHPQHGVVIRKSPQHNFEIEDLRNSPDFTVQNELMHYQNQVGHNGGFAGIHEVDNRNGLTYHEYIKGTTVDRLPPKERAKVIRRGVGRAEGNVVSSDSLSAQVRGMDNPEFAAQVRKFQNTFVNKVPIDMDNTIQHLQQTHPNVWDHNKSDNVLVHGTGPNRRLTSIDLQGAEGAWLHENGRRLPAEPGHYFKNRQIRQYFDTNDI